MLSEATTAVVNTPPSVLMWSPAQAADRDGVTKQAVTKLVRKFAGKGLTVERDASERIVRFNIAEYDHLRGKVGDPSKDQRKAAAAADAGEKADRPLVDPESYEEALRKKTWTEAERSRLRLAEEKGELIRKDRVAGALARCAEEIVRPIEAIASKADELALAAEKGGTHGLRIELKKIAHEIRREIAKALAGVAEGAPVIEVDDELQP